jgi:hypothetical protein
VLSGPARIAAGVALAASLVAGRASADNVDDDDLVKPRRLTVGVADDLLGQLARDGKTLYFVSNRDTTNQLFAQSMNDGRAWPLFDDGADVTWPRVSPDGGRLLYISFRDSAAGQLCTGGCRRATTGAACKTRPLRSRPSGSTRTGWSS